MKATTRVVAGLVAVCCALMPLTNAESWYCGGSGTNSPTEATADSWVEGDGTTGHTDVVIQAGNSQNKNYWVKVKYRDNEDPPTPCVTQADFMEWSTIGYDVGVTWYRTGDSYGCVYIKCITTGVEASAFVAGMDWCDGWDDCH